MCMQKFDEKYGIRRRVVFSNMKAEDIEDYYASQYYKSSRQEKLNYIRSLSEKMEAIEFESRNKETVSGWILLISTKEGKTIGKMEVYPKGKDTAIVAIEIPNEMFRFEYGVEVCKQFKKICSEGKYFKNLIFVSSEITERYKRDYGITEEVIVIA